jgi:hypothetical protein
MDPQCSKLPGQFSGGDHLFSSAAGVSTPNATLDAALSSGAARLSELDLLRDLRCTVDLDAE